MKPIAAPASPWVAACLALASISCGDDEVDTTADDTFATSYVASALDFKGELSRLVVPLEASPDLGALGQAAARARKVQNAINSFRALVANPACVAISTDNATFLALTFNQCRVAIVFTLNGSLRADVTIEVDGGGAPIALDVSVSSPGLTVMGPIGSRTVAGGFGLHHAIPPAGTPVQFDGELTVVDQNGDQLSLTASAEWTVAATCVTFTGGAQLEGDVLDELGPVVLSGRAITRCGDQCPTSGTVEVSYGRGKVLGWTYTGADTATVVGPRGKRVDVPLPCGGRD